MQPLQVIIACSGLFGVSREPAHMDDTTIASVPTGKNTTLTMAKFQKIRTFVLTQGLRQTYCNKFNNNPFYPFANFNLYLNPPDQRNINCDPSLSDFPVMVVQTTTGCNQYWDIWMDEDENGLVLLQYHSSIRPDTLVKEAEQFFQEALVEIDRCG